MGSWSRALVEAHLGNVDAAAEAGERASRLARAIGFQWIIALSEMALGFLRLSAGQEAAALAHLLPLLEKRAGVNLHPSLVARTLSDAIEALVGTGELGRAETLAGRLEEHARAMPVPSAIAAAARCRAFVLAQGGDLPGARASIEAGARRTRAPPGAARARAHLPGARARSSVVGSRKPRRAPRSGARRKSSPSSAPDCGWSGRDASSPAQGSRARSIES